MQKPSTANKSPSRSGSTFMIYFISALFVVAAIASGIQLVRFYNVTSADQEAFDDIKLTLVENTPAPKSRFNAGAVVQRTPLITLPEDTLPENVIVVGSDMDWLTPITGDEYSPGDPTVSLVAAPTPTPSLSGSAIKVSPSPTPRAHSSSGDIDFTIYRGGMGIDFQSLYEVNPDVMGWIRIDDTPVDYPVVQGDDNDYYLNRSFKRSKSSSGVPFLDFTNSFDPMDSNLVIYGHNMGNGKTTMFSSLLKYYDEEYFNKHPVIEFDTVAGAGSWRIFSVFKFDVNNISDFNYTQHNFGSLADFQAFIANAKAHSLYDCGVTPEFGSHIITLSTCDRGTYGRSGRCVIMAMYTDGTMF